MSDFQKFIKAKILEERRVFLALSIVGVVWRLANRMGTGLSESTVQKEEIAATIGDASFTLILAKVDAYKPFLRKKRVDHEGHYNFSQQFLDRLWKMILDFSLRNCHTVYNQHLFVKEG